MNANSRDKLDHRIHAFFVAELKKEFKDDFALISDKVDILIHEKTIKDVRMILSEELNKLKKKVT
jgi:hypothetical protein